MGKTQTNEITPLRSQPDYLAENERLTKLQVEREQLSNSLARVPRETAGERLDRQAGALLGASAGTATLAETANVEASRIHERLRLVDRAIELQRERLAKLAAGLSRSVCERLQPRHRELVRRQAELVAELRSVSREEQGLRDSISDAGYSCGASLPFMAYYSLDELHQTALPGCAYILDALRAGYLTDGDKCVIDLKRFLSSPGR